MPAILPASHRARHPLPLRKILDLSTAETPAQVFAARYVTAAANEDDDMLSLQERIAALLELVAVAHAYAGFSAYVSE